MPQTCLVFELFLHLLLFLNNQNDYRDHRRRFSVRSDKHSFIFRLYCLTSFDGTCKIFSKVDFELLFLFFAGGPEISNFHLEDRFPFPGFALQLCRLQWSISLMTLKISLSSCISWHHKAISDCWFVAA